RRPETTWRVVSRIDAVLTIAASGTGPRPGRQREAAWAARPEGDSPRMSRSSALIVGWLGAARAPGKHKHRAPGRGSSDTMRGVGHVSARRPLTEISMKKTYVLDTNVLLHDPFAINKFEDNDLVLPIYVIE